MHLLYSISSHLKCFVYWGKENGNTAEARHLADLLKTWVCQCEGRSKHHRRGGLEGPQEHMSSWLHHLGGGPSPPFRMRDRSGMKKEKESAELLFSGNTHLLSVSSAVLCVIRATGCSEKPVVGLERLDCHRQAWFPVSFLDSLGRLSHYETLTTSVSFFGALSPAKMRELD